MTTSLRVVSALAGATTMLLATAIPVASAAPTQTYAIQTQSNATFVTAGSNIAPQGGDDFTVRLATTLTGARRMPFPIAPYGESHSQMYVSSNGNIQFPGAGTSPNAAYTNACLPTQMPSPFLAPYWDDLQFEPTGTTTPNEGIYTRVVGTAPNRQFIVNWRGHLFSQADAATRFGVIFYENNTSRFSYQYQDNTAAGATIGVQRRPTSFTTQYSCNSGGSSVQTGLRLTFVLTNP